MEIKSLFISKKDADLADLHVFCDLRSIKLDAHSFLQISELEHAITFDYDVIFFSSKNAVTYFLKSNEINPDSEIGVAGTETKNYLESLGYFVHFTPKESGDISQSTEEFKVWIENKQVLFPVSTISQKSYATILNPKQYKCVEVYHTEIHSRKIEPHDLYVFTSPSNVKGFFKESNLDQSAKIISWGETTTKSIQNYGFEPHFELKTSSMKELIQILSSVIEY